MLTIDGLVDYYSDELAGKITDRNARLKTKRRHHMASKSYSRRKDHSEDFKNSSLIKHHDRKKQRRVNWGLDSKPRLVSQPYNSQADLRFHDIEIPTNPAQFD